MENQSLILKYKIGKTVQSTLLLICFLAIEVVSFGAGDVDQPVEVTDSFFMKQHSLNDLKFVLDEFDTYDYVRTKNQREELVSYLLSEFERLGDDEGMAKCQNILGVLKRDQAKYAEAIGLHESALKLSGNDTILQIYSLNNLGVVYRRMDKPRMALDYHMEALQLAEQYGSEPVVAKRSISVALNSIGNINLSLNQIGKALEVFNQTLAIERSLNNGLGLAINYQNIGYCFEAEGRLDTALVCYRQSLRENEKINSDVGRSICYNSIGQVLLKQDKSKEALGTFLQALIYAKKTQDDYYISQTHANIGKSYLALKDYDRALPELLLYRDKALKISSGLLIQDAYRLLSDYYKKTGNYEHSLELYQKAVQYNDSILNEKNTRYLNEIQTLYESKKKQQQIELLMVENQVKTQQNYIYLFVVILVLLLAIVIYILLKKQSDTRNNELEARLFRSLMNPHFIFNALGSIQSFLYKNEPEKAANYLGHFSKLTRAILQNSNKDLITLEEELKSLKSYIEIEQMRQDHNFSYEIVMDDDIEVDFIYVPPTLIQPFVENAIHHGIHGLPSGLGYVHIEIEQLTDYVSIKIIDNGKGINKAKFDKNTLGHKSMGLNIFKERIRIIQKKYKKSVIFAIQDRNELNPEETGTLVKIDFPLIEPDD